MATYQRSELGDFNSIVCFKAVILGMEEMLGEQATAISLKAAGRQRGMKLAQSLGFARGSASVADLPAITRQLDAALGVEGTRLCRIDRIEAKGDGLEVFTAETICSAGENFGSPRSCTFTLGAVQGALEYLLDKQFFAKHTESVLRGGTHDVFAFTPR